MMKNLKKLSRESLKDTFGGKLDPNNNNVYAAGNDFGNDCHVHYRRNPDGSKGPIVSSGTGACHPVSGTICETFSSGSDGKCY